MTKRSQIEALLKEGKNYKEIAVLVNSTTGYVSNTAQDLRTGGITAAQKRFIDKHGRPPLQTLRGLLVKYGK